MRPIVRILAPVLAAVAIALAGGTSALAAERAATPSSWDLDASWCFDDVVLVYCFDVDGKAQFVDNSNRSSVVINERFHTVVYQGGVQVGESVVNSHDRFAVGPDGTYTVSQVSHTTSVTGDEVCSIQTVWRQVEYETVVDHWSGGCS